MAVLLHTISVFVRSPLRGMSLCRPRPSGKGRQKTVYGGFYYGVRSAESGNYGFPVPWVIGHEASAILPGHTDLVTDEAYTNLGKPIIKKSGPGRIRDVLDAMTKRKIIGG